MNTNARAPRFNRLTSTERRADLIEAGLTCMARGGIQEFTVDRICAEAGVSRGLITHHFGSMSALLTAVYAKKYDDATSLRRAPAPGESQLSALLDALLSPEVFNRESYSIWLTLWGQICINEEMRAEHRAQYAVYVSDVAAAIDDVASRNGRIVDARMLARTLIPLLDGLGIQHAIDPDSMPLLNARSACRTLLEPHLGPF
ncbi:TetR/AcrR family transcriptional regulator [Defluviimonas sp. WL0002]|uniref:TetR/AcrR family transcriptional regulator n=1 Tax=Albidovulum marisflavi TaxID=2984159 RepID=A0ABT2Z7L2_9RHOB|nr:TetR/AcrR family transcriptional regulator [Defluviimonas sp. WL0002]MCV2867077.1 TetR/AcrR family transcriptional regulator [Defluviimonas sp. WL0002]